jgi:hypothetical protein
MTAPEGSRSQRWSSDEYPGMPIAAWRLEDWVNERLTVLGGVPEEVGQLVASGTANPSTVGVAISHPR